MATSKRIVRRGANVDDYNMLDEIEHLLLRPDTMAGSVAPKTEPMLTFSPSEGTFSQNTVTVSDAASRMFLEVLSNASDNSLRTRALDETTPSRKALISSRSPISVVVTRSTVTVTNVGEPIPLNPHPTSKGTNIVYVPWLVFGNMRSGSNLNDGVDRTGAGRNGYGAKVANILSTEFRLKVGDPANGHEAHFVWRNNMRNLVRSEVKPGFKYDEATKSYVSLGDPSATRGNAKIYKGREYVEVSYDADFARLGISEYTDEIVSLFARYVAECTFTTKFAASFNGTVVDLRCVRSFVRAIYPPSEGEDISTRVVVHYEWAKADEAAAARLGNGRDVAVKAISKGEIDLPLAEIVFIDAPDSGEEHGFINGLNVPNGLHINEAVSRATAAIVAASPKAAAATKGGIVNVRPADVRGHFSTIVNCHVPNPTFSSQTKQDLTGPIVRFPGIVGALFRSAMTSATPWAVARRIEEAIEVKERRVVAKTDGRKRKRVDVESLTDANDAGGPNSSECTIFITEGVSAGIYASTRIDYLPKGRDRFGVYPIRGKFINARKEALARLLKNKEYCELKTAIGLSEGVDYSIEANAKTLRYGRVCILADADEDGASIRSLLINCFALKWPSFVRSNRLTYLATPAIRVVEPAGAIAHRFYSDSAFTWWSTREGRRVMAGRARARHIKGLSTSSNGDVKDDVATAPTLRLLYGEDDEPALELAFGKNRADDRKRWITAWRERSVAGGEPDFELETAIKAKRKEAPVLQRSVATVINGDLAEYSFGTLRRAIPSVMDGMKHSQRQALWSALRMWNYGEGAGGGIKSMKVSRFAASVAEATSYAHGEVSMQECLVTLGQGFTGTNNIPLMMPDGQFGSRAGGPKMHGACRYIYTKLNWSGKFLFQKTAVDLIPRENVEGEMAESQWLPCDISLAVVNGAAGIATGWATFIPCHHPIETADWYISRIDGKPQVEPRIWYYGSSADNKVVDLKRDERRAASPQLVEDDDTDVPETRGGKTFVSRGIFKIVREPTASNPTYDVTIEELPVGLWTNKYIAFLNSLVFSGRLGEFRDCSKTHAPRFELFKLSTVPLSREERAVATTMKKEAAASKGKPAVKKVAPKSAPSTVATVAVGDLPPLTHELLQLVTTHSLNNYTLLQPNGCPKLYANATEILNDHFEHLDSSYAAVKAAWMADINERLKKARERYSLIEAIVEDRLVVFKAKKDDIIANIARLKLSSEQFSTLRIEDATAEELEKLTRKIKDLDKELKEIKSTPHLQFWKRRLLNFKSETEARIASGNLDGSPVG